MLAASLLLSSYRAMPESAVLCLLFFSPITIWASRPQLPCTASPKLSFPDYYTEGTVFQADVPALIIGFTTKDNWWCPVTVTRTCDSGRDVEIVKVNMFRKAISGTRLYTWEALLTEKSSGEECSIKIVQESLTDRQTHIVNLC